jgi:hypothetical protein
MIIAFKRALDPLEHVEYISCDALRQTGLVRPLLENELPVGLLIIPDGAKDGKKDGMLYLVVAGIVPLWNQPLPEPTILGSETFSETEILAFVVSGLQSIGYLLDCREQPSIPPVELWEMLLYD